MWSVIISLFFKSCFIEMENIFRFFFFFSFSLVRCEFIMEDYVHFFNIFILKNMFIYILDIFSFFHLDIYNIKCLCLQSFHCLCNIHVILFSQNYRLYSKSWSRQINLWFTIMYIKLNTWLFRKRITSVCLHYVPLMYINNENVCLLALYHRIM